MFDPLTVSEIAAGAAISPSQLTRLFRAKLNLTPKGAQGAGSLNNGDFFGVGGHGFRSLCFGYTSLYNVVCLCQALGCGFFTFF